MNRVKCRLSSRSGNGLSLEVSLACLCYDGRIEMMADSVMAEYITVLITNGNDRGEL